MALIVCANRGRNDSGHTALAVTPPGPSGVVVVRMVTPEGIAPNTERNSRSSPWCAGETTVAVTARPPTRS